MPFDFTGSGTKDTSEKVAISLPVRPGSVDPRSQQVDVFPLEAFDFDDPKTHAIPVLRLKAPWVWSIEIDVNEVKDQIGDMYNPDKLTPSAKLELYRQWLAVVERNAGLGSLASSMGVTALNATYEAYLIAYTALSNYLNVTPGPLVDLTSTTVISWGALNGVWQTFAQAEEQWRSVAMSFQIARGATNAAAGTTRVPTAPTVTVKVLFDTAYLVWDGQSGLIGTETCRVDRAPDVTGSPGTWATIATVAAHNYTDQGLALNGTDDDPLPKIYWWRVYRIINAGTDTEIVSSASGAVSGTADVLPETAIAAASITAAKIDVANLFAQEIELNTGGSLRGGTRYDASGDVVDAEETGVFLNSAGALKAGSVQGTFEIDPATGEALFQDIPIRSYQGSGVQRRATQLDNDSLDWIDTPVSGSELLQARIGRLGVGGAILMDGEYFANLDSEWSSPVTLSSVNPGYNTVVVLPDKSVVVMYINNPNNYLHCITITPTGTVGSPVVLTSVAVKHPKAIVLQDGTILCGVAGYSNNYYYTISRATNGTWGALTLEFDTDLINYPCPVQKIDGTVFVIYSDNTTKYLRTKEKTSGTWGGYVEHTTVGAYYTGAIHLPDDTVLILFTWGADTYLVKIDSYGSWDTPVVQTNIDAAFASFTLDTDDSIYCFYRDGSDTNIYYSKFDNYDQFESPTQISTIPSGMAYPHMYRLVSGLWTVIYTDAVTYIKTTTLQRYARIGAGIIESGGDDTNGRYIKYSDGTMLQWRTLTITPAYQTISGNIWNFYYNGSAPLLYFPVAFVGSSPAISSSIDNGAGVVQNLSTGGFNAQAFTYDNPTTIPYRYIAIGRWRA